MSDFCDDVKSGDLMEFSVYGKEPNTYEYYPLLILRVDCMCESGISPMDDEPEIHSHMHVLERGRVMVYAPEFLFAVMGMRHVKD